MSSVREVIRVSGMSCAACSVRIEKALSKDRGITECYANFSNNTVSVVYDDGVTDRERIFSLIEGAGYSVLRGGEEAPDASKGLRRSLAVSIAFAVPLLILGMGPMFGLDTGLDARTDALIQLILCIPVVIAGRRFFLRGIPALFSLSPTMDTLVALGSGTAFVYSLALTVMAFTGTADGHLYYDSAAMILTLVSVGKYLESRSRERTKDAVNGLKNLSPDCASVIVDGTETTLKVSDLKEGMTVIVRPGERIPSDARITEGSLTVDESMITGESNPADRSEGDTIYGGTVNLNGSARAEIVSVGDGTVLSGIIRMIEDAQSTKAPVARLADRVAARFVPAVMITAVAACILWLFAGKDTVFALTAMISVLVISCPCALGLATPMAITVGTGRAAEYGILFRNATSLEYAGRIDSVILDKTGTVTVGRPSVIGVYPDGMKDKVLRAAYAAEVNSEHPIGKAIVEYCEENDVELDRSADFVSETGTGVRCTVGGEQIFVGRPDAEIPKDWNIPECATVVTVSMDGGVLGAIAISDTVRDESRYAVDSLKKMGISVMMVTGDIEASASNIASEIGVNDVISCAKPEDKIRTVKKLQAAGHDVAMVGDGINDAPALTQSDLGIAIGTGTDIAMDSSDVISMNGDLRNVPAALEIGRATMRNIKENLFFAFCYNAVCIPIAAGLPYLFGMSLIHEMPIIAAAAMSLSSLSVVSNALRLRKFRPSCMQ